MYAARKGWPLDKVHVVLEHRREVRTGDLAVENGGKPVDMPVDMIDRIIGLDGALTPEQRAKLIEIAEKCPVHRTLTNQVVINTALG